MATTTIPWGDGSGDNIYLEYSASQGDQTVLVSSDANGGAARSKDITFSTGVGGITKVLSVSQVSGLPYDSQIEYLESTMTQHIDTGIVASNSTCVEIDANWTNRQNTELIGARTNTSRMYELLVDSSRLYFQYGNSSSYATGVSFGTRHLFKIEANVFSLDGVTKLTANQSTFNTGVNLTLFALNNNGNIQRKSIAKIYSVKITDGVNTLRDMIPVRVGNTGYLYDKVSKTLFENKGTGSFRLGPDV